MAYEVKKLSPEKVTPDVLKRLRLLRGQSRQVYERSWYNNAAHYLGFQWHAFDDTGELEEIDGNPVKFTANKLQQHIMHSTAKLTSNPPDFDVEPVSSDLSSIHAARVSEKWLEYMWDSKKIQHKSKRLATIQRVTGTAAFYPRWNPHAGGKLDPSEFFRPDSMGFIGTKEDLVDAFDGNIDDALKFLIGEKEIHVGDIDISVLSPFDFYVDESASEIEDMRYVAISKTYSIDSANEIFGSLIGGKKFTPQHSDSSQIYKWQLKNLISPNLLHGGFGAGQLEDCVTVTEYYERPRKAYPDGLYVIHANDSILYASTNPYAHTRAELPICPAFDVQSVAPTFWGIAAMESAIQAQKDYNKARVDLLTERHATSHKKVLDFAGSGVKPDALFAGAGEVVTVNAQTTANGHVLKPEVLDFGGMSNTIVATLDVADGEIKDALGVHDVSQGKAPAGLESGVALRLMLEADDTRLGLVFENLKDCYQRLGEMLLDIGSRFIAEKRTFMEIAGENEMASFIDFTGTDLSAKRVRVVMGSFFDRGRAALAQSALSALQYGGAEFFDSVDAKQLLFEAIGMKTTFNRNSQLDEKRAEYEIKLMERGIPRQAEEWNNHDIHLKCIERRMNDISFDRLPMLVKNLLMNKRNEHLMFLQQKASMMMQQPPGPKVGIGIGVSSEDIQNGSVPQLGDAAMSDAPPIA